MNRQILIDLLTNILSSQGYDVNPLIRGTHPRTDLVVAKDGRMTCIQYGGTETDLRYFADAARIGTTSGDGIVPNLRSA